MHTVRSLVVAVAVTLGSAGIARADESPAVAQALFDEGKRLLSENKVAEACTKLAESQRVEPSGGTVLHLATCHVREGKTATAWAEFHEAASVARRDGRADRETYATEQIALLEPKLARLRIVVASPSANVVITRNGNAIAEPQWGTPLPVDPGEHLIKVAAAGKKAWSATARVQEPGATVTVNVAPLEEDPAGAAPSAGQGDVAPPRTWSTQKTFALVAAGVGIVGIGVGTFFGLKSKSNHDDALTHCQDTSTGRACDPIGVGLGDDAIHAGNLSTASFVVGGVGIAGAAVLWFTAPRARSAAQTRRYLYPVLTSSGGGVTLGGSFR